jgi:hypothetical protein
MKSLTYTGHLLSTENAERANAYARAAELGHSAGTRESRLLLFEGSWNIDGPCKGSVLLYERRRC